MGRVRTVRACCLILVVFLVKDVSAAPAENPPLEYVDNEYQFAFQFPADWKLQKGQAGEAGEVRVLVKHPSKPMHVIALVGQIGKTISKRAFETSPNRDAVATAMMEWTVEQVYKKSSRDIGAQKMVVSERRVIPSDAGLKFYISTAQIKDRLPMLMAGQHIIPFDKPYMVAFLMVTPVDKAATSENEIITRVFNSFHILGERPLSNSPTALPQEATCVDFRTLEGGQKMAFAYGYLEGIQAALDKEVTDILVPLSDERHPAWLVLPAGLGEKPALTLANKLDSHCRSTSNAKQTLLTAFLAIAHKQDGWPSIGISTDKKKTDPWRNLLGGKESSVSCVGYIASRDETRQAIIHGYYLGTRAWKARLGGTDVPLVWPANSTPQAVRLEVDQRCQKEKNATVRDVMWLTTAELSARTR